MDPYIGQIESFAFGFAPKGWASCNGQMLMISQNPGLFSLIGSIYGGDGVQTFALPDLRGRVPINQGSAPGYSKRTLGNKGGQEISSIQMVQHEDEKRIRIRREVTKKVNSPVNDEMEPLSYENILDAMLHEDEGLQEFEKLNNMPPYLIINYCIAVEGVFPERR